MIAMCYTSYKPTLERKNLLLSSLNLLREDYEKTSHYLTQHSIQEKINDIERELRYYRRPVLTFPEGVVYKVEHIDYTDDELSNPEKIHRALCEDLAWLDSMRGYQMFG